MPPKQRPHCFPVVNGGSGQIAVSSTRCLYRLTMFPHCLRYALIAILLAAVSATAQTAPRGMLLAQRATAASRFQIDEDQSLLDFLADIDAVTTDARGRIIWSPVDGATYQVSDHGQRVDVPLGMVYVPNELAADKRGFGIGRYEVTNAEYQMFLDDAPGYPAPVHWFAQRYPDGQANFPVVQVSREDAFAYCAWVAEKTGWSITLPSADQQRVASVGARRGARFAGNLGSFRFIGADPADLSASGCYDLVGGAREWTLDNKTPAVTGPDSQTGFRLVQNAVVRLKDNQVTTTATTTTTASPPPTPSPAPNPPSAPTPPELPVVPANLPPTITQQPANQTVLVGASTSFTVAVSGTGPFTFRWVAVVQGNGQTTTAIPGTNVATQSDSSTGSTLTVANASTTGGDLNYTVTATNAFGSVTSSAARLDVRLGTPPSITTQPRPQTVNPNGSATFTVVADGFPAPAFQWNFNGSPISGATSASFSIATVTTGNAGSYTVTVTNSIGSTTSSPAALTVSAPPPPSSAGGGGGGGAPSTWFLLTLSGLAGLRLRQRSAR